MYIFYILKRILYTPLPHPHLDNKLVARCALSSSHLVLCIVTLAVCGLLAHIPVNLSYDPGKRETREPMPGQSWATVVPTVAQHWHGIGSASRFFAGMQPTQDDDVCGDCGCTAQPTSPPVPFSGLILLIRGSFRVGN